MVLLSISVVSILVLALLMSARSEQRSAAAFAQIVDARNLADLPINLAIGQIRRATEHHGTQKTWASQPGMIRVFGTEPDPASGNFRAKTMALYKLYTDEDMVVSPAAVTGTAGGMSAAQVKSELRSDFEDLSDWQSLPGLYVDMNEPAAVMSEGTKLVKVTFPIADPRARFARDDGRPVEGFNFSSHQVPGTVPPASRDDVAARLPMPVKWLYQLADGQLLAPTGGDAANGLSFETANDGPVPSANNPIVGRIAFWTDDESAKINVNTAAEGTPWEPPRFQTQTGIEFVQRQPVRNEYARYPGHPAQTALSPVFQAFGQPFVHDAALSEAQLARVIERYHLLSPRVPWGGSHGGTRTATSSIVMEKDDRLYATLDELVFNRDRSQQDPALTQQDIALGRFFLTTHSKAPELNLFNQPRVMLWPISADVSERNAKDKLLAFIGTGGGRPWYFMRARNFKSVTDPGSAQDPRGDLNLNGLGGNAAQKRNRELYEDYLVPLTGGDGSSAQTLKVPGFGGNFADKYTAPRRNQILTQMVDFLRWSVNSASTGLAPQYAYLPPRKDKHTGEASAVPLIPGNDTKGFGRWPTITEAAIVFMSQGKDANGLTAMQAFMVLEPFSPATGLPSWTANVRYRITGLDSFKADDLPLDFPAVGTIRCNTSNLWLDGGNSAAFAGLKSQFKRANLDKNTAERDLESSRYMAQDNEDDGFPFYSRTIKPIKPDTFEFSGGAITIEVQTGFGNASSAQTIQTLRLYFPPATLPLPKANALNTLPKRMQKNGDLRDNLIVEGDVTRSTEIDIHGPSGGDLRLVASMSHVPESWFNPHPRYGDTSVMRLHFLRQSGTNHLGQYSPTDDPTESGLGPLGKSHRLSRASTLNTAGSLLKGLTYARDCTPSVARGQDGILNAYGRPGDFDNGYGRIEDGPYINKADESNLASVGQYFNRAGFTDETGVSFSPNKQIASAIAFGSLPSGTFSDKGGDTHKPWQTLLFCPNPPSRSTPANEEPDEDDHEGFKGPRDHLWLDLFWMPVAEPYAMSESFATAGKINMNYQIQPFAHIERSSGIHAVLKPVILSAISPLSIGGVGMAGYDNIGGENYKEGSVHQHELHYQVNASETLKGFARRFTQGDIFRSASEICDIFLVPQRRPNASYNSDAKAPPQNYDGMVEWWNGEPDQIDAFEPTGDNSREAPYGQIYPRLTTKSNTYTVHFRVQALKKARTTDPSRWVEGADSMLSEHRGSATVERYLEPNDRELLAAPGGAQSTGQSWDRFYRLRIVDRKQFTP